LKKTSSSKFVEISGLNERFSRQVILPGVGTAGQEKWANSTLLLAGEGVALRAIRTALETAGASQILTLSPGASGPLSPFSIAIIVTEDMDWRGKLSRQLRSSAKPALFAWPAGSGYALFLTRHENSQCPCLDCFEVMNPKAFSPTRQVTDSVRRILGSLAASEALQWILAGESPLEGKVWITSIQEGISFQHEVSASPKCPAKLVDEGVAITP
jgi:molybdopterin/thiamine biosynthesis adenylyltransferase